MVLTCWSHTHIQELASRSYCGFTVQQRKAKARNAAFLWDHFAIFSFFFPREGYNSLAYLSPRVTACTTWTRNSTWEFCITLGAVVPLKATAVSPREPHTPRPFNKHVWNRQVPQYRFDFRRVKCDTVSSNSGKVNFGAPEMDSFPLLFLLINYQASAMGCRYIFF